MLNSDGFLEVSSLKSENLRWKFASILLAILLLSAFFYNKGYFNTSIGNKDAIYRVSIHGLILDDYERNKAIELLAKKDNVKGVIVNIDSPGGTMSGGEAIYNSLIKIKKEKPIVSVLGGVAASGGYMAAVASDHIFARKSTITGSIGVMLQSPEVTDLMDKIGVKLKTFKVGEYKGLPSPFEKLTPKVSSKINQALKDSYDIFVDIVSKNRSLPIDQVIELADGSIYIGNRAKELKLVDSIGGEDEAVEFLYKELGVSEKLPIIDYKIKDSKNILEIFLYKFFNSKALSSFLGLKGILALWYP